MSQLNRDPLVQILISAYRRGRAIIQANSQPAAGEMQSVKNTNAPDEGRLWDDGANGNSRNARSPKDRTDERTKP